MELTVGKILKNVAAFYETPNFTAVFTKARQDRGPVKQT
jgi:hypothetical protein